jgi:hypothetical protein
MAIELDFCEYPDNSSAQATYVSDASFDSYTKLLLHCDGTDGANTFIDSASGKTITANGHAQVDTGQKVFGSGSALFDSVGDDYLSIPYDSDFSLGSSDFTVDFWVRIASFNNYNVVCSLNGSSASSLRSWDIAIRDESLWWYWSENGSSDLSIETPYNFIVDTWYHVEVGRTGGKIYFFVNGILLNSGGTTFTGTIYNANVIFRIGLFGVDGGTYPLNGWLDEFRISKGIARHTSDFTLPNIAYYKQLDTFSEATIKTQGSYALKVVAAQTDSLNKTLTKTF